jgi:transcriptional regulator with XRE-family HTH domain
MTDNSFIGPMSMVKIDGAKIKLLREQQGLTQLYLATAVEVTTDTISRWENRRYPSIKRDNGLRLAEALNVELEDLLEKIAEDVEEEVSANETTTPEQVQSVDLAAAKTSGLQKKRILFVLAATGLSLVLFFAWYFLRAPSLAPFGAERILPPHCISGQPFPVIIKVTGAPDTASAVIIKETIPANATIQATSPTLPAGGLKNKQIKWLKKIDRTALYAYVITISGKEEEVIHFSGTAAISSEAESAIEGQKTIILGRHHWADSDKDNIISDDEILAVYDQYSEITDLDIDIDLIEEIWLGSAYQWDSTTATFKIIE